MILPMQIQKIFELHNLAKENAKQYGKKRFIYARIGELLQHKIFIAVAGLRGSGKTVILRQLAIEQSDSIYISLDALEQDINLFELAKELLSNYKIKYILLDEIHNYPNWQQEIKKIFDFLAVKLVFTSSAAIDIVRSKYDLSRRVVVVPIAPFSFREYLYFKKGTLINRASLDEILSNKIDQKFYSYDPDFMDYCMLGTLPACLEAPFPDVMKNIVEKILNQDLLTFGKLNREEIIKIGNILRFISRSSVDVCNYSAVAKNVGITRYKAQEYLELLQQTFLIRIILPYGSNVTKEPKILYSLPFRGYFAEGVEASKLIGALREEFFIQHVAQTEAEINYLKSIRGEKLPDYLLFYKNKKLIFEVGKMGKTLKQLKGVSGDGRFLVTQPAEPNTNKIPLIAFGFLY